MPFLKLPAACAASILVTFSASIEAQLHEEEITGEILVTGSMDKTAAQTALPVNILSGELLRERAAGTLGETLDELMGVNNASFGSGVGLPVIRGQSGNRVQVLQSGVSNLDASAVSPDHANSVDAALAERIEVIRGPATLLYGNGAIGGVVNVMDGRIPVSVPDALTGLVETRHDTASDEQTSVFRLDGGRGRLAWHIDGLYRDSNTLRIPGYATDPAAVDLDDPLALQELLQTKGRVPNSAARSQGHALGASWIFDGGHLGVSVNEFRSNYGLPAAAHAHHAEHDPDHEGHDHDHEEDETPHGGVRIELQQRRTDIDALLPLRGFFESAEVRLGAVDYEHAEIEGGMIGTIYRNEGHEGRVLFAQEPGLTQGVLGVQFGSRDFTAIGEEASIPETTTDVLALFTVQSIDRGSMTYELGVRAERQEFRQRTGNCGRSSSSYSAGASGIWNYSEDSNVLLALAHSQRSPTVEERYSNIDSNLCAPPPDEHDLVAHFATNRHEIGDPDARRERSSNIEFGWRRHQGTVTGEMNVFYNRIDDYLYLRDTGIFEDEVQVARIEQRDAKFHGAEAQLSLPLGRDQEQRTGLLLFADYVRARFVGGGNVPRIPALRAGAELSHAHQDWVYKLRATHVDGQDRVASGESVSESYTLLNLVIDYHTHWLGEQVLLFGKASNLLDEEIRNHSSYLKSVAPQPGRSFTLGVRVEF